MKEKENKKKVKTTLNKKLLTSAMSFSIFIILTILMLLHVTDGIDANVESFIIGIRNDSLTKVMTTITNVGSAYSLIVISILIVLIALIIKKKLPLNTLINLTSVFIVSQIFKVIIRRPRPDGLILVKTTGFSYPSGHTMVSFAYFTFIAISLCEKINNKFLKIIIKILSSLLVLAIGFSRIYLGAHYLSDVIAGYLLGLTCLALLLNIREKTKKRKKK